MLGVQLFTYVIHGEVLTEDRNFESFGNALLLLFQALTGGGPAAMMHGLQPCSETLQPCVSEAATPCGQATTGPR